MSDSEEISPESLIEGNQLTGQEKLLEKENYLKYLTITRIYPRENCLNIILLSRLLLLLLVIFLK